MRVPPSFSQQAGRHRAPCAALAIAGALWLGGCASPAAGAVDPSREQHVEEGRSSIPKADIAVVHRRKCGNCHARVEPGSLPRATIEAAMARHRRRAKLTEGQWAELIEFLSRGNPSEPHHTASLP